MYGNSVLPGISPGATTRNGGSIWRGYTESTWFQIVNVGGDSETGAKIPLGTILIQNMTDGIYAPMTESDIITTAASLPGARLVIVADSTGASGTTTVTEGETGENEEVKTANAVLVGVMGVVDQARLLVGNKKFEELTEAQRVGLRAQLEAWNFQPVSVLQA